jgi:hypothetical protein
VSSHIIAGYSNTNYKGDYSVILGGAYNGLTVVDYSSILGGWHNTLFYAVNYSSIIGGEYNAIDSNITSSSITGGSYNEIKQNGSNMAIVGGNNNSIKNSSNASLILAGDSNNVYYGDNSSILSGRKNTVDSVNNVVMIGGSNETATYSNTTYLLSNNINMRNIPTSVVTDSILFYNNGFISKGKQSASVGNADSLGHDIASTYVQFSDTVPSGEIATKSYVLAHGADSSVYATKNFLKTIRVNSGYGLSGGNTIFSTFTMTTDTTTILSKVGAATLFPYKSQTWLLAGNAGNDSSGTQFVGNTTIYPLIFKTNNIERLRITGSGKFGIGTSAPNAGLEIISPSPSATHSSLLLGDNLTNNTAKLSSISARN